MTPQNEARRAIALTFTYDILVAAAAMCIAVEARWRIFSDYTARPFPEEIPVVASLLFALAAALSFYALKIYRQVWRHSGWPDAVQIVQAVLLAGLIFVPMMFLWNRLDGFPRASLLICMPIWLVFLFSGRMLALMRSTHKPLQLFAKRREGAPAVLLVGDADELATTLRQLERDPKGSPVRVLGLIETTGMGPGLAIRGITVHGSINDIGLRLDLLKERYGQYPWVAAVGQGRSRQIMRKILAATSERGSEVMSLGASAEGALLEPVQPEDLLGRRASERSMAPIASLVKGNRLYITGAGGTIGYELSRQCAALAPEHITVFDNSEFNLYQIDYLLRTKFPDVEVNTILGDVRDAGRLARTMADIKPDIVIHAAALKQVPLMEMNPCEAILTNAGGAANAAQAAASSGAAHFVFISTDKAVDPDNVMGATKRLAEIAVRQIAEDSNMAASMVRFGNVLGSSGSVVPLFERQIEEGGPVTVTHPDITRFFMTVEEAVYLVLQAAAQQEESGTAALYVLNMGKPVRIQTLAESMIRMKGLVPGQDIKIVHTGLRPGDKMHEALTYDYEELDETSIACVRIVRKLPKIGQGFGLALESLLKTAADRDPARAVYQLNAMISNYATQETGHQVASTA
jgi:O-antigen biosynthesis protein WbqV